MSSCPPSVSGQRWLALRLTQLPLDALGLGQQPERLLLVCDSRQRLVAASRAALDQGVQIGQNLALAQQLLGGVGELLARDPAREAEALAQLTQGLYQFSPYVELYSPPGIKSASNNKPDKSQSSAPGLLLEVSRCLLLFGGLSKLSKLVLAYMEGEGYRVKVGLGSSAQGAWLLSFAPSSMSITQAMSTPQAISGEETLEQLQARLLPLPLSLIQGFPRELEQLRQSGFYSLGDLARQVRGQSLGGLTKRFGRALSDYLLELFGAHADTDGQALLPGLFIKPLRQFQPRQSFSESLQLEFPVSQIGQLHQPMEWLLQRLGQFLQRHQWQCQAISWQLEDIYHQRETRLVRADQPQQQWQLLWQLSCIQLEAQPLAFEVDSLSLSCDQFQPLTARSGELDFDQKGSRHNSRELALTLAKLRARLGEAAIFKLSYSDSHSPEQSNRRLAPSEPSNQNLPLCQQQALRPQWLLEQPLAIELRPRGLYWQGYLELLAGPERIEGFWWQEPWARDYFMARREDQLRLWIYQDLRHNLWYLQGIFA